VQVIVKAVLNYLWTRSLPSTLAGIPLGLVLCAIPPSASYAQDAAIVVTQFGPVLGASAGGMTRYLGIPYAAPPVGDLRWQPPKPPAHWTSSRDATRFGDTCPQTTAVGGEFGAPSATEDCLYLNVFVPAHSAPGMKHSVMVWIPGGGFFSGAGNDYDPTSLVTNGGVIVVSLNYRVGLLGFFVVPGGEREGNPAANYGLLDQQQALHWVRDNIAAFGGDPANVTIFGESAGAVSIYAHLASPGSSGLFQKAIVESGSISIPKQTITPLSDASKLGHGFATAMGCRGDVMACLRRLPVEQIINRQVPFLAGLVTNVPSVPTSLQAALQDGHFNHVPMIIGTNHDEMRWLAARVELRTHEPLSAEHFQAAVADFFGEIWPKVVAEYPLEAFGAPVEALAAAQTDAFFACDTWRVDHWMARSAPVYGYEFNDAAAPIYMSQPSFPYGAAHTKELQFIFPLFHGGSGAPHPLTAAENKLSLVMVRYWTNFAKRGDPNGANLRHWAKIGPSTSMILSLNVPTVSAEYGFEEDHKCSFWDDVLAPR
jgi:para-nitrobenzyl esterase